MRPTQLAASYSPLLYVERGEVLRQVLLDHIVRGLLGLTEPGDDQRKRLTQSLGPLPGILHISTNSVVFNVVHCGDQ